MMTIQEAKNKFSEIINTSGIPLDIMALIIENLSYSINQQVQQIYLMKEMEKAKEAKEEKEKTKKPEPVNK